MEQLGKLGLQSLELQRLLADMVLYQCSSWTDDSKYSKLFQIFIWVLGIICCILRTTLNSSDVVKGMAVELQPCLHFWACKDETLLDRKPSAGKVVKIVC